MQDWRKLSVLLSGACRCLESFGAGVTTSATTGLLDATSDESDVEMGRGSGCVGLAAVEE